MPDEELLSLAERGELTESSADQTAGGDSRLGHDRPILRAQVERILNDREKLDEYMSSVRELERRLHNDEQWFRRPKPKVDATPPTDIANAADLIGRTRLLFDLTHLALQTDSTRLVTIMLQRLGIETDQFANATGTLSGLDFA